MAMTTYWDFAENDRKYFIDSYKQGFVANMMAAMAQGICEKYLKHVIDTGYGVSSTRDNAVKTEILRAHSLRKLLGFLKSGMHFSVDKQVQNTVLAIDGYYFTTRYPGEDSIEIMAEDIEDCYNAIEACRDLCLSMTQTLEQESHIF